MADPIISPDGKFMWTGSEWIPAPPGPSQSAMVNLTDSVVGGDINIVNNDPAEIVEIVVKTLTELGISVEETSSSLNSIEAREKAQKIIQMSLSVDNPDNVIDAETYLMLGDAAKLICDIPQSKTFYIKSRNSYKSANDLDGEANSLIKMGELQQMAGLTIQADRFFRESLEISKSIADKNGIATSMARIASNCSDRGETSKSIKLYKQALEEYRRLGDLKKEAETLTSFSLHLLNVNADTTNSGKNCREAMSIAREIGNKKIQAEGYTCLAWIAMARADYDESERYIDQAIQLAQETGNKHEEADYLIQKQVVVNSELGKNQSSSMYLDLSSKIIDETGDLMNKIELKIQYGKLKTKMELFEDARFFYNEALQIAIQTGIKIMEAKCLKSLAGLENECGNINKSEILFNQCLDIYQNAGYRGSERDIICSIAGIKLEAGDTEKAKKLFLRALDISRDIENDLALMDCAGSLMNIELSAGNLNQTIRYGDLIIELVEKTGIRVNAFEEFPTLLETLRSMQNMQNLLD